VSLKIDELRTEYRRATLDETSVEADPLRQFEHWFREAVDSKMPEPNAMTLATVDADGNPSARIVLLKGADERGFTFFTNYASRKGRDLAARARAALLFYWPELERQIRIEGAVTRVDAGESTQYFAGRPRPSQLGAWASPQSMPIDGRSELEARFAEVAERYRDASAPVPRPAHWGGYRLVPDLLEFWQGRASRLHDRIRYRLKQAQPVAWNIDRLAP